MVTNIPPEYCEDGKVFALYYQLHPDCKEYAVVRFSCVPIYTPLFAELMVVFVPSVVNQCGSCATGCGLNNNG